MNRRKVILHIGPHKTGTTALQMFFKGNSALLAERGFYYPRAGCVYGGHHNLAWEVLLDGRFNPNEGGRLQLVEEVEQSPGQRTVIISSEDFSRIPVTRLSPFFQTLSHWDITVLCVYRPLREVIESLYAEEVKDGMTCLSINAFTIDRLAFDQRVRLDSYISMLVDFFGVKVKTVPYKPDMVSPIAALFGLPMPSEEREFPNKRLVKDELRRILTHRRQHSGLGWFFYFNQYVVPHLSSKVTINGELSSEDNFVLSEELVNTIAAQDRKNIDLFKKHKMIDYDPHSLL